MAKEENIFTRLTSLFRAGPVVKRRVKEYKPSEKTTSAYELFKKTQSQVYSTAMSAYGSYDRMARYSDFQEMEYCLAGDTKIAVPDGYKTLEELCNEYGTNKEFVVYSYDHNLKRIVPAIAKQARQTCVEEGFKVTFDTGKSLTGTGNHRLMLKDGSYRRIDELQVNDAMMPFYRKDLYTPGKDKNNNYRLLNTQDKNIGRGGWISEHKYIAEWAACRELKENEVVHHINFKKYDNNPNNLQIMTNEDHLRYHVEILNGAKWSNDNSAWIETFKKNHSLWMKNNNPAQRKDITFGRILEICEREGFNQVKLCKVLDTDPNVIKRHLRKNGFNNFEIFAKAYDKTWVNSSWNNAGNKNPRYRSDITYQKICNTFLNGKSIKEISASLNTTTTIVNNRIRTAGFKSFNEFAESYTNHKVVSIESIGKIPMFDITVDGYKNFATDSIISHNTPEIASALDIYSEETISPDENGNVVHIYSENASINRLLSELFYDTLNVNFNMTSWVRNMCKYGDFFLFNDVSPDHGVVNVFPISVNEMEREEGFDKQDPMAVRYRWITQGNQVLQNWQVSHFRLLGNDAFLPYGTSVLEAARRIWRQLILIEDAMLVYRVVRSPDRRVFYIDVGNVPPEEIPNYMEQAQSSLRKSQVVDKTTGRVDLRYNPLSVDEDYFIPVRGGASGTKIDTLAGGTNSAAIEDVQYIQKKLFSALKIPKAYLGYDEGLGAKATLSQEDIRFSRSINRIQRTLISELNKLAIIHLYCNGFDGHDLLDFEIKLTNPSTIAQQQKLELFTTKFTIANTAHSYEGLVDKRWIRKNIFSMTDEEIELINKGLFKDKELDLRIEAVKLPEPESAAPSGEAEGEATEAPEPENEPPPESPLGNLDFGEEKVNASHELDGNILDEDDIALNKIMKNLRGLPVTARSQLSNVHNRSLLDEKTGAGANFAQRDLHNRKRRKGTKGNIDVDHAALVGVDKKDPRDSIAHPFGDKKDIINPLKNAHKVKIDETDKTYVNNFLDKNIDITENRMTEIDSLIKTLRSKSSASLNMPEED